MLEKSRKQRILIVAVSGFTLASLAAYSVWSGFGSHRYNPAHTISPQQASSFLPLPAPSDASDFQVARFQFQQARITLVRFAAPAASCQAYAAALAPNATLNPLTAIQQYNDLALLSSAATKLGDLRWFDLPYARSVWTVQAGKPNLPRPSTPVQLPEELNLIGADANTRQDGFLSTSVRVDPARGVFYLLRAN